jgi:transposase-like protein
MNAQEIENIIQMGPFLKPFGPIEEIAIPRGRKIGFAPKLIMHCKALKNRIAKPIVEMFTLGISTIVSASYGRIYTQAHSCFTISR